MRNISSFIHTAAVLLLILVPYETNADNIKKEQAFEIARNKLSQGGHTVKKDRLKITNEEPATKSNEELPYYVIQDLDGGFVIVSNETSTVPVLAYSYSGAFSLDDAPMALKLWMGALAEGIGELKKQGIHQSPTVKRQWELAQVRTKSGTNNNGQILLETALWNQGAPYNEQCPEINGKKAPTGCGPTAMAIIMRYWKCPAKATFTYVEPYYFYVNNQAIENGGWTIDYDYDWDNMPLTTKDIDTEEEIRAVSTLMRDCGAIGRAFYGENATAMSITSPITLKYLLGFDKSAEYIQWNMMSIEDWQTTLTNEIRHGRPILFFGSDYYSSNHMFVGDGIDADGNMRMNWGWGGSSNGFYSLAPFGYENETRNPAYFYTLCAFINLEPDKGSPNEPIPFITRMNVQEDAIIRNIPFHIKLGRSTIENGSFSLPTVKMIISVSDKNGDLKELISKEIIGGNSGWIDCLITKPIETGDYIEVRYKYHDDEQWKPVRTESEYCEGIIILKDEISLQDFTQIVLGRKIGARKYAAMPPIESTIMQISTKRGAHIEMFNEEGKMVSNAGDYVTVDETGKIVEQLLVWPGDMNIPNRKVFHLYLSDIPKGKYTIKIKRHLEIAEFSFQL